MTVSGVVVSPNGKPMGGASVILRLKPRYVTYTGFSNPRDVLARKTTAADGLFAFDEIPIPLHRASCITSLLRHQGGAELLVLADGCGIAWTDVQELKPAESVRLTLEPEAKVSGTVCDSSGKATAGRPSRNLRLDTVGKHRFFVLPTRRFECRFVRGPD